MNARITILGGALLGLFAVALGAFGAHALKEVLVPPSLAIWEKASFYHFIHALALLAAGIVIATNLAHERLVRTAAWCFLLGVLLFSGSLYAYAVTVERTFAFITPLGGILLLIGWLCFSLAVFRKQNGNCRQL